MGNFYDNLPPGVSSNDYHINGPDEEITLDEPCPRCTAAPMLEEHYAGQRRVACLSCDYVGEWEDAEVGWTEDDAMGAHDRDREAAFDYGLGYDDMFGD